MSKKINYKNWGKIERGIKGLADEQFFHTDYQETLLPVYGDTIDPENLVVEGGVIE